MNTTQATESRKIVTLREVKAGWAKRDAAKYEYERACKFKKYASKRDELKAALDAAEREVEERGYATTFEGDYASACTFFGGPARACLHNGFVYVQRWIAL